MTNSPRRARIAELAGPKPYCEKFETFAGFLRAVVSAEIDGAEHADPRLEFAATATGLDAGVPSGGGFLVPANQSSALHERAYETGTILNLVNRWPAGREKFRIPLVDESSRENGSRFGGIAMNWTAPGDAITASKPKFAARDLTKNKLAGVVHVTDELWQDAPVLEATFLRLYGLEASFVIEEAILSGTGAGRPKGILNAEGTIEVAKESGQAAATIQPANIVNMFARLWASSKRRAVWLVNQDIAPQLLGMTWAVAGAVVPLFRWASDGTPLLMGRPVIEHEACPTLGAKGDIILADFGEYMLSDPGAVALSFSAHHLFTTDEGSFKFRLRTDGHPAWATPLTPKNGTATVSPFVTLAARA